MMWLDDEGYRSNGTETGAELRQPRSGRCLSGSPKESGLRGGAALDQAADHRLIAAVLARLG